MAAVDPYQHGKLDTVTEFENRIADFFGAPYAVAVDSCTHGLELALRFTKAKSIDVPHRTYLSVPMLADKLGIGLDWFNISWKNLYYITNRVIDAAVLWERNSYRESTFMCLSFQYQKHLSLGRGGMILCPDLQSALALKKMSYDGRLPGIPWREQGDIKEIGYHYYLTPETAQLGLDKLQSAIDTPPKKWDVSMWPDISNYSCFKK
jgi:dTDP-4-amino-4,6-dideoxygalactose transaminase